MKEPTTASLDLIENLETVDEVDDPTDKLGSFLLRMKTMNTMNMISWSDFDQALLPPINMEQPHLSFDRHNLHLDITSGGENYLRFVNQFRSAFPATPLHIAGREQPLPVLIKSTVSLQPPEFVDISMGYAGHVVYLSYNKSDAYLTAYKNQINGPWYELTLQGVQIKPDAIPLMGGHYLDMQSLGRVNHDDMQFGRAQLENAVLFLSTRDPQADFTPRQRQNFRQQCAKNLLHCIAYTSEAVRFSVIAKEIGGYMDDDVARRLVPHSPLLILAWDRISRALIHAAKHENPEDNFDFILDPKRAFPHLTNFKDCADAMGVLNSQKAD